MLPNLVGWGLRVATVAAQAVGLLVYPAGPVATVVPVLPVGPHFLDATVLAVQVTSVPGLGASMF